jgi:uncharacterized membrane protein
MTHALASLIAAAIVWIFVHLGIAGTSLRRRLVARLGEQGFRAAFSIVSAIVLVWLGMSWGAAGPVRVLWQAPGWLVVCCMVLMVPAVILFVGSVTTPNPTMVGGHTALKSDTPAVGILRVTRYPMLWSFALWAATHLIFTGTLSGAIFTGAFLIVAVAGMSSLDAKYAKRVPERWAAFAKVTSILPFAAILQRRNHFAFAEIRLWRIAVAVVLWFVLIALHPLVFAVNPWRYFA